MSAHSTRGREPQNPAKESEQHRTSQSSKLHATPRSGSQSRSSNASKALHPNQGEIDNINTEISKLKQQLQRLHNGTFDKNGLYTSKELTRLEDKISDKIHLYNIAIRLLEKEPQLKDNLADISNRLVIAKKELVITKKKYRDLESKIEDWDNKTDNLKYELKDIREKVQIFGKITRDN
jgi:chromosome segregation ATPase